MAWFKRKSRSTASASPSAGATAVAERPAPDPAADLDSDGLRAEIARLDEEQRAAPARDRERRLLHLRHLLGARQLDEAPSTPVHPEPDASRLPEAEGLPEVRREDLTPELLRAAVLRDGCLLVRELVPRAEAERFAEQIDRSFAERERQLGGAEPEPGYYEPFLPQERFGVVPNELRGWVREGGGVLAADAPRLAVEMLDLFREAGLGRLIGDYLGEPPMISLEKTTLRKADPKVGGAWHQDGHFMGPVRAANVWLSLSRCGDLAPGLDVVPRRLDELVTAGGEGSLVSYQVFDEDARRAAHPKQVLRPIFEPGDALIFDELFLHQTASEPDMPNPRFAVESWFFGGSAFPDYSPIAV